MATTPHKAANPLIHRGPDGRCSIVFEAAVSKKKPAVKKVKPEGTTYTVVGYVQTVEPAVRGGTPNSHAVRFRNGGMRSTARTFRNQPFLTGHDGGDVRSRGGTVLSAWVEELEGEMVMFFEILAIKPWAIEGFEDGTIDRFSIRVDFLGEITCTLHDCPIWSEEECRCWPGMEIDGKVVEFEVEDANGLELSCVNVPACGGTYVVAMAAGPATGDAQLEARLEAMYELGKHCGRPHPALAQFAKGGEPAGGFRATPPKTTMAAPEPQPSPKGTMDRAQFCRMLGLPETATDEEIQQKSAALQAGAAEAKTLQTRLDAQHVDAEIAKLQASHIVTDGVVKTLRGSFEKGGVPAFDQAIELVRASAQAKPAPGAPPTPTAAPTTRTQLQSDTKPAPAPGPAGAQLGAEPDAFEMNRDNPHLGEFMRFASVTAEHVRKHGSRQFHVVANLKELSDATEKRG